MPADHIYTGVWELYGEPFHKRWIWTLEDNSAYWVLGIYVVLLIVVQKRAWVFLRYLIYLWKRPVRLTGNGVNESPLLRLSEMNAVNETVYRLRLEFPIWIVEIRKEMRKGMAPLRSFVSGENMKIKWLLWAIFRVVVNMTSAPFLAKLPPEAELELDHATISAWFGIAAIVNGIGFIVTGVLLSLWLTNGVEAPIVRSQRTPYCDKRLWKPDDKHLQDKADFAFINALYEKCWDKRTDSFRDARGCSAMNPNNFKISFSGPCPFGGGICTNSTTPMIIEQGNITYRDFGINSRSSIYVNHRLTCSPVDIDEFIYIKTNMTNRTDTPVIDIFNPKNLRSGWTSKNTWLDMKTLNGPNKKSNASSGRQIATRKDTGGDGVVYILPTSAIPPGARHSWLEYDLHPWLRFNDSRAFLVTYVAQRDLFYTEPLKDPVFSANINLQGVYHPDKEIAATGCRESVQFCSPDHLVDGKRQLTCTDWNFFNFNIHDFSWILGYTDKMAKGASKDWPDEIRDDLMEIKVTSHPTGSIFSVYQHLTWNIWKNQYIRASTLSGTKGGKERSESRRLWADEVISWYLRAWYWSKFRVLKIVSTPDSQRYFNTIAKNDGEEFLKTDEEISRWSWCSRVLMEDGDYTNINFVGFVTSIVVMVLICLFSFFDLILFGYFTIGISGVITVIRRLGTSLRSVARLRGAMGRSKMQSHSETRPDSNLSERRNQDSDMYTFGAYETDRSSSESVTIVLENLHDEELQAGYFHDSEDYPLPMSDGSRSWLPV